MRLCAAQRWSVGLIGYPPFSRAEGAVCWSLVEWLVPATCMAVALHFGRIRLVDHCRVLGMPKGP